MILYLGNFISQSNINPTFSFALAQKLGQSYAIRTAGSSLHRGKRLWQMAAALWTTPAKVVLLDAYATRAVWYLFLLSLLALIRRKPYVLLLHSGAWAQWWQSPKAPWLKPIFRHAHQIVCTSHFLYARLPWYQEKARVIHNFVDIANQHTPPPKQTFGGKILWVREYQPRYGDDTVVQLAKQWADQGLPLQVTMVGPRLADFRRRYPMLPPNLTCADRMKPEEWYALSHEFDILLNTSTVDSMPITLLAAHQLGMPIMSTAVGGIPEIISEGESGWLFSLGQEESMTTVLETLLANPAQLHRFSLAASEKATQFTWKAISEQWHTVLNPFLRTSLPHGN